MQLHEELRDARAVSPNFLSSRREGARRRMDPRYSIRTPTTTASGEQSGTRLRFGEREAIIRPSRDEPKTDILSVRSSEPKTSDPQTQRCSGGRPLTFPQKTRSRCNETMKLVIGEPLRRRRGGPKENTIQRSLLIPRYDQISIKRIAPF